MRPLDVASLEATSIDDHHALVTFTWSTTFEKTGEEQIRFDISCLLRLTEMGPLILAYVTHEGEQEVMEAKGLIRVRAVDGTPLRGSLRHWPAGRR